MDKNFVMYWLPTTLLLIGLIVYTFWETGIYGLIYWLAIGIVILLLYFWGSYWLKKMYKLKKEEYY